MLLLDVRNETLMQRLAGRRICPKCGTVYNIHSMPPGANDLLARRRASCTSVPTTRKKSSRKRLEVYEQQTRPLIEHYSKLGLLRVVAGEGELEEVFERMEAAALAKPVPADKVKVTRRKVRARRQACAGAARRPSLRSKSARKQEARRGRRRAKTTKRAGEAQDAAASAGARRSVRSG